MPQATFEDVEKQRERIRNVEGIDEDTREAMLEASKVMGRYRSKWGYDRHESILKRLIMLAWGGEKYDDPPDACLADALEDKDATGEIVEWIHDHYENEETNRDMRGTLRTFGKVLTNDDPTDKEAAPPPSIDWVPATLPSNYDPVPNPASMITWTEAREQAEHPATNARDAAAVALAWDAGPRSGELEDLTIGDISDHDLGKLVHVDGKTGMRDVTITNAVPYVRKWLNEHPGTDASGHPEDSDYPLWSKLDEPEEISYRMYRDMFKNAARRVGLDKPNDPTNYRKSSASALASKGVSQAHLEKRYGWKRGSDAAARYIRVFGEDADRELAKARGMDVEFNEPEPDGPTDCKRCGVLIDREAVKCDNCGFIQDRKLAVESTTVEGTNMERMVRGAVRETIAEMWGIDPADSNASSDAGLAALAVQASSDDLADPDARADLLAEVGITEDELEDVEVPTTQPADEAG